MARLIDADKLCAQYQELCRGIGCMDCPFLIIEDNKYECELESMILQQPIDAEPTEEQVKEYCRKRCLVIVTSELFNEIKARGSAEPVKHGYWIKNGDRYCECSVCHHEGNVSGQDNYCWFCGAKMETEEMME